mgnify:CR=1 FL=1
MILFRQGLSCAEKEIIYVEKLDVEEGSKVTFDQVLTIVNDADVRFGKPLVAGAKVIAKVVEQGKADKIFVFKYKKLTYNKG